MNEKLIALYDQLESLSSDLQTMMVTVQEMQRSLASLTKDWLERTAPDVLDEQAAAGVDEVTDSGITVAMPVMDEEPAHNDDMAMDDDPCAAEADEPDPVTEVEITYDQDVPVAYDEMPDEENEMPEAVEEQPELEATETEEFELDSDIEFVSDSDTEDGIEEVVDDNLSDEIEAEPVSGQMLPDLRKLFTLNDKYRFRRELFGNDGAAMNDTVDMLSAMNSMSEAEDYIYNDMGWDPESEEVKDFMDVVKRRFTVRL